MGRGMSRRLQGGLRRERTEVLVSTAAGPPRTGKCVGGVSVRGACMCVLGLHISVCTGTCEHVGMHGAMRCE
jgi:hypothetical protein